MSKSKKRHKKRLCLQHRETQYLHALNKVMDGKADPDYATKRFNKLKEIK